MQAKGSDDNLASREKIIDRAHYWGLTGGVVEVPVLIGFNPRHRPELGPEAVGPGELVRDRPFLPEGRGASHKANPGLRS